MDGMVNPAMAWTQSNGINAILEQQSASQNKRNAYNRGYNDAMRTSNATLNEWKACVTELKKKLGTCMKDRDVAKANVDANLFSSREKSKMIAELKGAAWQQKWEETIHNPVKDKIYFDYLRNKGYNMD